MEQTERLGFLLTITAKVVSRTWTDAGGGGQNSLRVVYKAVSDASLGSANDGTWTAVRDASCGKPLTLYSTFTLTNLIGTLRLREYTVEVVPNSNETVFNVAAIYNSEYRWANISGVDVVPTMHLPPQVEFTAGERMTTVWRNASWTTGPSANLNTTADIGGTKVDSGGKGVPIRIPTMDIKISLLIDTSQTSGSLVSMYDDMNSCQGKWNSTDFLHWGIGQVYCVSADLNHVRDEYYRATYVFRWDRWSDCEQICELDADGYPFLVGGQAKTVFWKSLARDTINFNLIFDTQANVTLAKQICFEGSWLTYP